MLRRLPCEAGIVLIATRDGSPLDIDIGRPLRPTAYWQTHNLDLNLAISVLHQELDTAARNTIPRLAA